MNLIVNVDKNWGIGKDNKLLVRIPADMKFFRESTTGKVVVMGRKTLESFPNGLPLKNRTNIVLTSNPSYQVALYDIYPTDVAAGIRTNTKQLIDKGEEEEQVVCDYVGAMTDRFAIATYNEIYIPKSWSL